MDGNAGALQWRTIRYVGILVTTFFIEGVVTLISLFVFDSPEPIIITTISAGLLWVYLLLIVRWRNDWSRLWKTAVVLAALGVLLNGALNPIISDALRRKGLFEEAIGNRVIVIRGSDVLEKEPASTAKFGWIVEFKVQSVPTEGISAALCSTVKGTKNRCSCPSQIRPAI